MKWWHWLILELLIIFGVMAWIYFFPNEIEDNFAKGMIGFVLIYAIENCKEINRRNRMSENYTVEQNAGEKQIEGEIVSISDPAKVYTCKDCLRHRFCYLSKVRKDKACSNISLYEENLEKMSEEKKIDFCELQNLVYEITDLNESAIAVLEKENVTESNKAITILKCNNEKMYLLLERLEDLGV